jgi:hypothetical protein
MIAGCSVTLHYLFFAAMEILAMLLIIKYSWKLTDGADPLRLRQQTGKSQLLGLSCFLLLSSLRNCIPRRM